jgi:aryl-alcohol dehydrogenase-like predicted oxidoreductase
MLAAALPEQAAAAPQAADPVWKNKQSGMTYRRLGRTNYMVSSIGMGGDDIRPDNIDQVLWSVDMGLNYFDTAPNYGNGLSEKGYAAVHKARGRDKVFQVTKVNLLSMNRRMMYQRIFDSLPEAEQTALRAKVTEEIAAKKLEEPDYIGPYFSGHAQGLRQAALMNALAEKYSDKVNEPRKQFKQIVLDSVDKSLASLGTDYLDAVLMRGVETPYEITNTPEVFEAFEIVKKAGKARYLGFSAHSDPAGVLDAAIGTGVYSFGMVAYHFANHARVAPVIEKAHKADFGVLAMKASRVLQNPYNRREMIAPRVKALNALVPGDLTLFQKGFRFALNNPNLSGVVIGMTTLEQAKENVPLAIAKG